MPLFENCCVQETCSEYRKPFEWYAHNRQTPDPQCESCSTVTKRVISRFSAPWTGALDRFDNPNIEGKNDKDGGHFATRIRSSRNADGSPEQVLLRTRQDQVEFVRAEGLVDPADLPPSMQGTKDGISNPSDSRGMPGTWV